MVPAGNTVLSEQLGLHTGLGGYAHTVPDTVVDGEDVDTGIDDTLPGVRLHVQRVGLTLQQVGEHLVDGKVVTTVYIETLIELTILRTCVRVLELGSVVVALHHCIVGVTHCIAELGILQLQRHRDNAIMAAYAERITRGL